MEKYLRIIFCVVILLTCCLLEVDGQTVPSSDTVSLGGINVVPLKTDTVCPSLDIPGKQNWSTSTFTVEVDLDDSGDPTIEWVVYGGWITNANSKVVLPTQNSASSSRVLGTQIRYFYLADDLYEGPGTFANIEVQWDTTNITTAWVAVRQKSEWGCTDGLWSVYTLDVYNKKPHLTLTLDPDIHLAYDKRLTYILPKPIVSDPDACPWPLEISYTITRPISAPVLSGDSTLASRTLNPDTLDVGDNVITWTVNDGKLDTIATYHVIIDPQPIIPHIAWTNPLCAGGNGTLHVSDTLNYAFETAQLFRVDAEPYSTQRTYSGLNAGAHTVQSQVVYDVDEDWDTVLDHYEQLSPVYTGSLTAPAVTSVDSIPSTGNPDVVISNATCATTKNGMISLDLSHIVPQNSSLNFDGVDDHLKLNKYFNTPLSNFSVAAWLKVPTGAAQYSGIISFNNGKYFQLSISAPDASNRNKIQFETEKTSGGNDPFFSHSVAINDGKWHLIVATYEQGRRTIFVDGIHERLGSIVAGTTVGSGTTYGMIGARSTATSFGQNPAGNYFKGQIAEVAVWNNTTLDSATVTGMLKYGISNGTPSSRWVLNDIPSNISATQTTIFSDYGNGEMPSEWARTWVANATPLRINNSPFLYSWEQDIFPKALITNLDTGLYKFYVNDIFGCGNLNKTYRVKNIDTDGPEILVNAALFRPGQTYPLATQISDGSNGTKTTVANLAIDGYVNSDYSSGFTAGTIGGTDDWWHVNLGLVKRVKKVNIYHASAGAPVNFCVMISSTPFSFPADWSDTLRVVGFSFVHFTGIPDPVQSFNFDKNAQYVMIRNLGSSPLLLSEVEVLSPQTETFNRYLYLGNNDCSYIITPDDGSINPAFVDGCGKVNRYWHNKTLVPVNDMSLVNLELPLNPTPTPVLWSAIDDNADTTRLTINYTVLDTTRPWFRPADIVVKYDTISNCDVVAGFNLNIPNGIDNYNCPSAGNPNYNFKTLLLRIDNHDVKTYTGVEYDPLNLTDVYLVSSSYLADGDHVVVWKLTDNSDNWITDTLRLHVQKRPSINSLRSANITCNGLTNGLINISDITYETGKIVTYFVSDGSITLSQATPIFNSLTVGSYTAWIEVDGCRSNNYGQPITITEPLAFLSRPDITAVECAGYLGSIDLYPTGAVNLLHLLGGENNIISLPNYTALNLTTRGTIEALVYFDSISATINTNAIIIAGNGYGLQLDGGNLSLVVNGGVVLSAPGISQRTWYHVAGTWSAAGTFLYIDGVNVATGASTTNTISGGILHIGCTGVGPEDTNLHGIVRFARVWNDVQTTTQMASNTRFEDPINSSNSLVANIPMNTSGGGVLANKVGPAAALVTTPVTFAWQAYAYCWKGVDAPYVACIEDLINVPAQRYHLYVKSPYGCDNDQVIQLTMTDNNPPVIRFYEEDKVTLDVDNKLIRNSAQLSSWVATDGINAIYDCNFVPLGTEFNPNIIDGTCPSADVVVTWQFADLSRSGSKGLDSIPIMDTISVNWRAVDGAGNFSNKTMTYIVRDTIKPTLPVDEVLSIAAEPGHCYYTVPNNTMFVPIPTDNCTIIPSGLRNNFNFTNNLLNSILPVKANTIQWIYRDKWSNADTMLQTITVYDNQPPVPACKNITVDLDALGLATIDSSYIDNGSNDNCLKLNHIHITKNIAIGKSATQSPTDPAVCSGGTTGVAANANDGKIDNIFNNCSVSLTQNTLNPYWDVDLGSTHTIYGINVFSSSSVPLNNFYVLISTDPNFGAIGTFNANVVYNTLYNGGNIAVNQLFAIPGNIAGRYVRIWSNTTTQLSLAEVEVYGTTNETTANILSYDCNDVRYASGTGFSPIRTLLTAIDENNQSSSCSANVTVRDVTPPTILSRNFTTYLDNIGSVTIPADSLDGGTTDACGGITLSVLPNVLTCFNKGNNNVTLTAIDKNGNSAQKTNINVIVKDTTPPNVVVKASILLPLGPDGFYVIQPKTDIVQSLATDNCDDIDELIYSTTPDTVKCDQQGYIDLRLSVRDLSGNIKIIDITAASHIVQVIDNTPPTASINKYTLYIQADGDSIIKFTDIIPNGNLHDNCDKYIVNNIQNKQIKYDATNNWCDAGQEGSGGTNANSNIALQADNTVSASEAPYSTFVATNANDGVIGSSFISGAFTGDRWLEYNFGSQYRIDSIQVRWHEQPFITTTPISQTAPKPTVSAGYITVQNTSFSYGGATGLTYLNDGTGGNAGTYNNTFDTNDGAGGNGFENLYVQYDFGANVTMSNTCVNWSSRPATNNGNPYIQYRVNGSGTWVDAGDIGSANNNQDYTLDLANVSARYVRLVFDRRGNNDVQIKEWIINRTTGHDCVLPATASVDYFNGSIMTPIIPTAPTINIGRDPTTSDNTLKFSSITTNRLQLKFGGTTGYIGVKEWRVYGKLALAASACTKYTCSAVHTDVPVWLQWTDAALNSGSVQTTVHVEPYFNIKELQIKDCGVEGERYYPKIDSLKSYNTYTYSWYEVQDRAGVTGTGANQSLFETEGCNNISDASLPYSSYPEDWAILECGSKPADGSVYQIKLKVKDNNQCYDTLNYQFRYVNSTSTAISVKPWEACVGDIDTFKVIFTDKFTFWRKSFNQFRWVGINPAQVDILGGGTSMNCCRILNVSGSNYNVPQVNQNGDSYIIVRYRNSTIDNGVTTNIRYEYKGSQYTGTVSSTQILTGTGAIVPGNTLIVRDSLEKGGPYWTDTLAVNNQTIPNGTKYVLCNGNTWWNDYVNCLETLEYQTTVYAVTPPDIVRVDPGNVTSVPANVCPLDTVWYRVNNLISGQYTYFDWSINDAGGNPTGRILAQGNWYDDSIRVVWDKWPLNPKITVKGFNKLDCSTNTVTTFGYSDTDNPVLGTAGNCSSLNVTSNNTPGLCTFTFANLPPPLMQDDCHNRIKNFANDYNSKTNAADIYPVGITTVTWNASDYADHSGTCSHTVTVFDNEAPTLSNTPSDTTMVANASCQQFFNGGTRRDITAYDNCSGNTISILGDIDYGDNGTWDVTGIVTTLNDPSNTRPFPLGKSRVRWTASDNVLPTPNTATTSFLITVVDQTKPTFSAISDFVINNTPGMNHVTYADMTGAGFAAPLPVTYCTDNCTLSSNIIVSFISRSDFQGINATYPIDTTIITWRATDASGNWKNETQRIIVKDNQPPTINPILNTTITACKVAGYRLPIPTTSDNSNQLDSLYYTVTGPLAYSYSNVITTPGFDPNGNGFTSPLPVNFHPDADYLVSWRVVDHRGNDATMNYTIHVEILPHIYPDGITVQNNACGGSNTGTIVIGSIDYEGALANVVYTIDSWSSLIQTGNNTFSGLPGRPDYGVQIEVNGCRSDNVVPIGITEPAAYILGGTITQPYCEFGEDGAITPILSGGVIGQFMLTGAAHTVANYAGLSITNSGMIECWVYLTNANTNASIVAKNGAYGIGLNGGLFSLQINGITYTSNGTEGVGDFPLLKRWYHIAGSWKNGDANIHINSAVKGSWTGVANAPVNANNVSIGSGFNGIIRELRIWNSDWSTVGDVSHARLDGNESFGGAYAMVGYWPLDERTVLLTTSANRKTGGTDAVVAPGSWSATPAYPQPGTYSWSSTNGYSSDLIFPTALKQGDYELRFVDIYGCPNAAGQQKMFYLTAQDITPPVIYPPLNVPPLYVDNNCVHIITDAESGNLLPDVRDEDGYPCGNTILSWQVYSYAKDETTPSMATLVGIELGLGRNTIFVTATQNGHTSSFNYDVYVSDDIQPISEGRNSIPGGIILNNTINNGTVKIAASDFNESSRDNCTADNFLSFRISRDNGLTYNDSATFTCADIATSATIILEAKDQAGNLGFSTPLSDISVSDIYPPAFILGSLPIDGNCAVAEDNGVGYLDGIINPSFVLVEGTHYGDNCSVQLLEYRLSNATHPEHNDNPVTGWNNVNDANPLLRPTGRRYYEGVTEVWYRATDPTGNVSVEKVMFTITVLDMPNPDSVIGN